MGYAKGAVALDDAAASVESVKIRPDGRIFPVSEYFSCDLLWISHFKKRRLVDKASFFTSRFARAKTMRSLRLSGTVQSDLPGS